MLCKYENTFYLQNDLFGLMGNDVKNIFLIFYTQYISSSEAKNAYFMSGILGLQMDKGVLPIRRIFSLVDMITKPKFSNCPNIFKIGLFR